MSAGRSLGLLLVTVTALAGVVAIGYGAGDGAVVWLGLAALGASVLGLAHALSRRRPRLGSMRRQFTVGVAVAVGQLVVLAAAAAQLMFVSAHDALLLMVVVVFAGMIAVRAAQLLATTAIEDVEALRDTLVAVGEGSRTPVPVTGSSDELAELASAANTAIVKLDRSETAQRNLIAAVSHDLRTPITSLRLLAEAVGDDIVDAPTRRGYLGQMRTHIEALSALIDDLFELSRLEAGDIQWTIQQVALGQLVEEAVGRRAHELPADEPGGPARDRRRGRREPGPRRQALRGRRHPAAAAAAERRHVAVRGGRQPRRHPGLGRPPHRGLRAHPVRAGDGAGPRSPAAVHPADDQ
jgi:signal transduction histidine kinase